jgi:hypothetical protein
VAARCAAARHRLRPVGGPLWQLGPRTPPRSGVTSHTCLPPPLPLVEPLHLRLRLLPPRRRCRAGRQCRTRRGAPILLASCSCRPCVCLLQGACCERLSVHTPSSTCTHNVIRRPHTHAEQHMLSCKTLTHAHARCSRGARAGALFQPEHGAALEKGASLLVALLHTGRTHQVSARPLCPGGGGSRSCPGRWRPPVRSGWPLRACLRRPCPPPRDDPHLTTSKSASPHPRLRLKVGFTSPPASPQSRPHPNPGFASKSASPHPRLRLKVGFTSPPASPQSRLHLTPGFATQPPNLPTNQPPKMQKIRAAQPASTCPPPIPRPAAAASRAMHQLQLLRRVPCTPLRVPAHAPGTYRGAPFDVRGTWPRWEGVRVRAGAAPGGSLLRRRGVGARRRGVGRKWRRRQFLFNNCNFIAICAVCWESKSSRPPISRPSSQVGLPSSSISLPSSQVGLPSSPVGLPSASHQVPSASH